MVALQQKLDQIVKGVVTRKLPRLEFNGAILAQQPDLNIDAQRLTRESVDMRGEARIGTGEGNDVPLVGVEIKRHDESTVMVETSYKMSVREMGVMKLAATNLQQATNLLELRIEAADRVLNEATNRLGAYGMPSMNIKGMLNNDFDVRIVTDDPHQMTEAKDLVNFVTSNYSRRRRVTRKTEQPNMILLTETLMTRLTTTFFGDGAVSAYDAIMKSQAPLGLRRMYSLNELESAELELYGVQADGTDLDRMMIYNLDPSGQTLNRKISRKEPYPVEYRDREYIHYIGQRVSSVYANYTASSEYVDYPKAA